MALRAPRSSSRSAPSSLPALARALLQASPRSPALGGARRDRPPSARRLPGVFRPPWTRHAPLAP
eukprot:472774-Alexandrium_andersonii.AAC.1